MDKKELGELKNTLLKRKEQLIKNIAELKKEIGFLRNSEATDEIDFANINTDSIVDAALSKKQQDELKEIEYILTKIEDNSYGVCEMCEEEIEIQRLKLKPHARYCVDCREIVEKVAMPSSASAIKSFTAI